MQFLHTMVRVTDLKDSLDFYVNKLGLKETRRSEHPEGKFTLVFLAADNEQSEIELTYNWENTDDYDSGRNFGHLAFSVTDIYSYCSRLQEQGVQILRPPRDGRMAFIRSPDQVSIEILQEGKALPPKEPWASMPNQGTW